MGICDLSLASPFLSILLDGVYPKVSTVDQLTDLNADCLDFLQRLVYIVKREVRAAVE